MTTCAEWRLELPARWEQATQHPFLTAVAGGDSAAFARWLPQDVIFVADLVRFQARLLARAPRSGQRALADGLVGIVTELDWFDEIAAPLGFAVEQSPLPATLSYRALLDELDASSYPVAMLALWVLERVYLEAWEFAGRGPVAPAGRNQLTAAVEHWTDPGFRAYVDALEVAADAALATEGQDEHLRAVVARVLDAEISFWEMAVPGTAAV